MDWLADNAIMGHSQINRIDIMAMPAWVDMIPVFSAIITVAGISIKTGRILQKLDSVIEDVKNIKTELKQHGERVTVLETKVDGIEKKLVHA